MLNMAASAAHKLYAQLRRAQWIPSKHIANKETVFDHDFAKWPLMRLGTAAIRGARHRFLPGSQTVNVYTHKQPARWSFGCHKEAQREGRKPNHSS